MRIVYLLAGKQVLAADEWGNGGVYVDPPAVDIYPAYNPLIHGTFTKDGSLLPAGFTSPTVHLLYMVDDAVTPTDVLMRYHVKITPTTLNMIADGSQEQEILFEILDSGNNPITTGSYVLSLKATGGFISPKEVTTVSGQATATFYAGRDTIDVQIIAGDAVGALFPGISESISIESELTLPIPPDLVPKPFSRRAFYLMGSNADAVAVGTRDVVNYNGNVGNTTAAMSTHYQTASVLNDVAGFETAFSVVRRNFSPKLTAIFEPPPSLTNMRFWIGFADAALSGVTGLGLAGIKAVALRFASDAPDTVFVIQTSDGTLVGGSTPFTFAPGDATLWKLELYCPKTGNGFATLTKLKGGSGQMSETVTFDVGTNPMPAISDDLGVLNTLTTLTAGAKDFKMSCVYVEQDAYDPS